jgi:hypothetical protein
MGWKPYGHIWGYSLLVPAGAVIEWDTDEPSTTQVKYDTTSDPLNYQTALPGLANAHAIVLTNLNAGTTYYFSAMSMDSSGNLSESPVGQFTTVALDKKPPSGSITINSGADYTNSITVTLSLLCTDASGCAHMQFSNDNTVWSTPEDYQNIKSWTLSSGDGPKTVKFQDGAGIWSGAFSDSITLQTVAPITTASPAGGTYTSALSGTLTANKPATIYYTTDGNDPTPSSPVYSSPISITTTTTLKFFAIDLAGNREGVKTAVYTINLLKLLSPNGGEVIPSGSTYAISWTAPSNAVKFNLMYSVNNGSAWSTIATNISGTSYQWTVPVPLNNKKKCLVKVIGFTSFGTKVGEDKSDKVFTIEVVKVTAPNGGEGIRSGGVSVVTWQTNATVSPVAKEKLLYTIDGGTTWKLITTRPGNPGSFYPWEVPWGISSTKCKVKVVLKDASGNTVGSDVSDKVFTIMP